MGLLEDFLGDGQPNHPVYQDFQAFVNRYDQGQPHEGYSGQEVMQRYQQVAPHLSASDFHQAASSTFSQMSPQQRMEFGQFLQQQMQQHNLSVPAMNQAAMGNFQDPNALAHMTSQLHQQHPHLLSQLLGGGGIEGMLGSVLGGGGGQGGGMGGMLGGAMGGGGGGMGGEIGNIMGAVMGGGGQRGGGGGGGLLENPLAKAVLAGIVAMAVKRVTGRR